jgi:uncharacterized protein (DUF58 family)
VSGNGNNRFKYLRPEDIRHLDSFEFAPKAVVEGYYAGRHRSRSRGSSTEFHDYRQYSPGDDPALVDWRVFARSDRHFIRTFVQETDMNCTIFLDSSASMGFGEPISKLEYASFFAAALAYLVIRSSDRVALQTFDDGIREFFPPGGTRRHLNQILTALENNTPGKETSLAEALSRSFPLLRRRGALVILSDFLDDTGEIFSALSPYIHRGFRIYLFHILDPMEMDLPNRGLTTFHDLETGGNIVAHTEQLRQEYSRHIHNHMAQLRQMAVRRRIQYVPAQTNTTFYELFDSLSI